jgi:hypothetical protein
MSVVTQLYFQIVEENNLKKEFFSSRFYKFSCGERAESTGIWGGSSLVRGSTQFASE